MRTLRFTLTFPSALLSILTVTGCSSAGDTSAAADMTVPDHAAGSSTEVPKGASAALGESARHGANSGSSDTTPTACTPAASPGRGVVQTLVTSGAASVGIACGKLYIASGVGAGPKPWKTGTLRRCESDNCAATLALIPSFGLHFQTSFSSEGESLLAYGVQQPFSGATGPLDTPGDVLRLTAEGTVTNLGPILDAASGPAASFRNVVRRGKAIVFGWHTYHNHGDYGAVALIRKVRGTSTVKEVVGGFEVGGSTVAATPSRVFAIGRGLASGARLIDTEAGTASAFYAGSFRYGFTHGERVEGVGMAPTLGAQTYTQVMCESDASCAAPSVIANAALPRSGYLGVAGDELVWHEPSVADPAVGSLKTCSLAPSAWGTTACIPQVLANEIPTPNGDEIASDGHSLYLATHDQVLRVGL